MENIRSKEPKKWGETPFSIGLWVGQKTTPNTTEESHNAIEKEREHQYGISSTPAQLTTCPWCGAEIQPGREIVVDRECGQTHIYCGDPLGRCEFSRAKNEIGLPVVVVDDEIYHRPPTMLIATVDKFAMMAWKGAVRTLFGKVSQECPRHGFLWPDADCNGNHKKKGKYEATVVKAVKEIRPPDLIIQDEFHLISGPLGTMVGLYETAVDDLCSWQYEGKTIDTFPIIEMILYWGREHWEKQPGIHELCCGKVPEELKNRLIMYFCAMSVSFQLTALMLKITSFLFNGQLINGAVAVILAFVRPGHLAQLY